MSQPARLSSGLLARKGEAFPAGGFATAAIGLARLPAPQARSRPCVPDPSSSIEQARPWPPAGPGKPKTDKDERVALTVRLDPARHTRLKIFCARRRRTGQDVMIKALDAYLQAFGPDCACVQGERSRS